MAHEPTPQAPATSLANAEDRAQHLEGAQGVAEGPTSTNSLLARLAALGQRRTFLVNTRSQLRAGFLTATCSLVLLLLLNLSLYSARRTMTEGVLADSPELGRILHAQNRVELALVITASIVFLVGVFVVTVLETHKTAGAAYNLARHMAEIEQGHYGTLVHLRKDDNLRELEVAFNGMSAALAQRAADDARQLEALARSIDRISAQHDVHDLARQLRARAEQSRGTYA